MERRFASTGVACAFVLLLALLHAFAVRAATPAATTPGWIVTELPTAIGDDAAAIAAGKHDASFLSHPGTTLRAATDAPLWYRLRLDADWTSSELPVLVVRDIGYAHATLYAPPDYRAQSLWLTKPDTQARFSRHAMAFVLPAALRADQSLYLRLDRVRVERRASVAVTDLASYQAADLRHVRIVTLFSAAQFTMVLVGLCLWIALRDRVYALFVAYSGLQLVYLLLVSGEFYDLPLGALPDLLGQRASWIFAVLSAPLSISFILEFCNLRRQTPRMATVLAATRWPYVLALAVLLIPIDWPARDVVLPSLINLMFLVGSLIAIAAVSHAAMRRNRAALFFLVAWMPQVAFTALRVTQLILHLPQPPWLEYGFPFTTAFSSVVVVLGLADATLHARRERDVATRLAERDGLTGVLNRRAITRCLETEFGEAIAHRLPLALLFVDLDHFKAINDRHGHLVGDHCLKTIAVTLADELQDGEHFGRYGGEEFLAVLPGSTHAEAIATGERLRKRVAHLSIETDGVSLRLTASIGVAGLHAGTDSPDKLIERADAALYRAKAEGRNRVCTHAPLAAAGP
ncbi:MAG TPA: diguanylate cyclase [Dokdonella sp.]|nr:diguanylate cyclase [Dokdonella sp.]